MLQNNTANLTVPVRKSECTVMTCQGITKDYNTKDATVKGGEQGQENGKSVKQVNIL